MKQVLIAQAGAIAPLAHACLGSLLLVAAHAGLAALLGPSFVCSEDSAAVAASAAAALEVAHDPWGHVHGHTHALLRELPLTMGTATHKATLATDPALKKPTGIVPLVTIGSFEFPRIPAIEGFGAFDVRTSVDFRLDGVLGANLLQLFRVTFAGPGERHWLESDVEPFVVPAAEPAPAHAVLPASAVDKP